MYPRWGDFGWTSFRLTMTIRYEYDQEEEDEEEEDNKKDKESMPIRLNTSLPVIQNRTVRWIVEAYKDINNSELVKKVSRDLTYFPYLSLFGLL